MKDANLFLKTYSDKLNNNHKFDVIQRGFEFARIDVF